MEKELVSTEIMNQLGNIMYKVEQLIHHAQKLPPHSECCLTAEILTEITVESMKLLSGIDQQVAKEVAFKLLTEDVAAIAKVIPAGSRLRIESNHPKILISAAKNLQPWASIYLNSKMPHETAKNVAIALVDGAIIYLDSNTPQELISAVARFMPAGRLLHLPPEMPLPQKRLAAEKLANDAYLYIDIGSKQKPDLHIVKADYFYNQTQDSESSLIAALREKHEISRSTCTLFSDDSAFLNDEAFVRRHNEAEHKSSLTV